VPVQAHKPQIAEASTKGPSKADRLTADKAPKAASMRRKSEREGACAGTVSPAVAFKDASTVCALASLSVGVSGWVFIVKM
jgi:hypothetical protein